MSSLVCTLYKSQAPPARRGAPGGRQQRWLGVEGGRLGRWHLFPRHDLQSRPGVRDSAAQRGREGSEASQ